MSKSKSLFPYAVTLMDGAAVTVLGRSPKGAASYAAQVAGLAVNRQVKPERLDDAKVAEAINRQEERV
ncbi:MAG: hypothetical protein CMF68_08385 [Magnetovibrio sp.]|nr:hypothetical protein [Magnetovibrio sp.]